MAIIIRGKSVCHVCGSILAEDDDVQLFPPALLAEGSRGAHLNDSGVHRACFEQLPEHDEVAQALAIYLQRFE